MAVRAVLYLRQSVDATGEGEAIARQRSDCTDLASARGWRVVDEFVDNDTSATARRRPAFEAMMRAARARGFDVIVAWHVDRLVRRLADLEPVLSACQDAGIQIATATGELDPATDSGRLVARILSSVAQAEVERKGIRQRRANRQRAEHGQVRLVRRPFGYDMDGRMVRREVNALKWAAEQALGGRSVASVARDLNRRGVLTSTGHEWRASSLMKVLRNPRYAGVATYHGVPVATGRWTPVFSVETHQRLITELDDPVRRRLADPVRKHLLSGLALCGRCGERLSVNSDGRTGRRIYRCPRVHLSRRLDAVDATVVAEVLTRVREQGSAVLLATDPSHDPARAALLRRQMADLGQRASRAAAAFDAGAMDARDLGVIHRQGRAALAELERDYATTVRAPALAILFGAAGRSRPDRSLAAAWTTLTLAQQRDVITALVEVTVLPAGPGRRFDPTQVVLDWRS